MAEFGVIVDEAGNILSGSVDTGEQSLVGQKQPAIIVTSDGTQIEVDCYIGQTHNLALTPTRNKVERGIDVSDHAKEEPRTLKLKGIVSDHQISLMATLNSFKTLVDSTTGKPSAPSDDTFTAFKQLYTKKELVTVYTNYDTYESMLMTNFSTTENKDNSESIEFDVTFEEIKITENVETDGTNLAGTYAKTSADTEARAQKAKKATQKAKKAGETVEKAGKKQVIQSWLSEILKWLAS